MTVKPHDDPTGAQYGAYQNAYDYFNDRLFGGRLPRCMLNFSRKSRRVLGFFAAQRWEHCGARTHEISLNPDLLDRPLIDVMSTLGHEMAHLWQSEFGTPSGGGYHNEEWAKKMEEIGLMPSQTGMPGGRRTGQQMTHYVIEGGPFHRAFELMPTEYKLPWQSGGLVAPSRAERNKFTYRCPGCGLRVWGKPQISIVCGICREYLLPCCSTTTGG
jgi:predicted SprT family Zn-dependent metalloprotease